MATDIDTAHAAAGDSTIGGGAPAGSSGVRPATAPRPQPRLMLCPYCGHESGSTQQCEKCRGLFEPLSRQASQNAMGPWFLRDESMPFRPGFSYETLRLMVSRGRVTRESILRGPTTRQFWTRATGVPGVSHLLGVCHACQHPVSPKHLSCPTCGTAFSHEADRQYLGLGAVHLLPGQGSPEQVAASSFQIVAPTWKPPRQPNEQSAAREKEQGEAAQRSAIVAGASSHERSGASVSGVEKREDHTREHEAGADRSVRYRSSGSMVGRVMMVLLILVCFVLVGLLIAAMLGPEEWVRGVRDAVK